MTTKIKPVIWYGSYSQEWHCWVEDETRDYQAVCGYGDTPIAAYEDWKERNE